MPYPQASTLVQSWESGKSGARAKARSRLYAAAKRWAQGRKFFVHTWVTSDDRVHIRVYLEEQGEPLVSPT